MKHVVIGKEWRPSWFEHRRSDGSYAAFNAPMRPADLKVQTALLPEPVAAVSTSTFRSRAWAWAAFTVVVALLYALSR